jgi:hypothetical protein
MGHPQANPPGIDDPTDVIQSSAELKSKPHKWYYYLWDTLDKPKEDRWFMFKLDAALLTFASLGRMPWLHHTSILVLTESRVLYQISRSKQYQQRFCLGNVSIADYHQLMMFD